MLLCRRTPPGGPIPPRCPPLTRGRAEGRDQAAWSCAAANVDAVVEANRAAAPRKPKAGK
jgi:hypothetical protein